MIMYVHLRPDLNATFVSNEHSIACSKSNKARNCGTLSPLFVKDNAGYLVHLGNLFFSFLPDYYQISQEQNNFFFVIKSN